MTIVLNESGFNTGMKFTDYAERAAQHGDDPRDYSSNEEDFIFVSPEYAAADPNWDVDPDWPEDLPVWEYRPS
jgi:hypothetical protein